MPTSIDYRFTQRFRVPANRAYLWCTDYDPRDPELMHENAKRKVRRLSKNTFILTDTSRIRGKIVSKTKLIRLRPSELSWTSTHIAGPIKYSQFIYKITPEGMNRSRLDFLGLQLEHRELSEKEASDLARKIRKEDSAAWKYLAGAMEKEFSK